ncbi:MAG: prolipoprotein diacylglyceryl transferase [Candidatus Omnitrophota bacterium]
MYPEICKLGPFTIYSYGLMLVIAFMAAAFIATREAKRTGVNPDTVFNLCFIVFISGVIGARIFYVLANFPYYLRYPQEMIMLQKGGLAWFGGLILGTLSGLYYLKAKKLGVYRILDLLAPAVVIGQAIGRLGCFLNGCCFGKESAYGIFSPAHGAHLIPTQLYSSLFLVIIFIFLRYLQRRPHQEGAIFFTYLFLYSAKRFLIEFWRGDSPILAWGLTLFQFISIAIFLIALTGLFLLKTRKG